MTGREVPTVNVVTARGGVVAVSAYATLLLLQPPVTGVNVP